ncbi:MAG: hypothetical protein ACREQ4_11480 [Candidatus Binataceae bacterium]
MRPTSPHHACRPQLRVPGPSQLIALLDLILLLGIALVLRANAHRLRAWTGRIIDGIARPHAASTPIAGAILIARPWLIWTPVVLAAFIIALFATRLAAVSRPAL